MNPIPVPSRPAPPRLIGGEMYGSDTRDNAATASVLAPVIDGLVANGQRVFVAGPHPSSIITSLVSTGAEVTWFIRSLPDAMTAAAAHPNVTVVCGHLSKLDEGTFDLVIATAGLNRLCSVEGEQWSWQRTWTAIAELVAPGGDILVRVDNPLALDQLNRLDNPDTSRLTYTPESWEQLTRAVTDSALTPAITWCVFGSPEPGVLIDDGSPITADTDVSFLGRVIARAVESRTAVTRDVSELAYMAARTGQFKTLASAWLVHASRGTREHPFVPAIVVHDGAAPAHEAVCVIDSDGVSALDTRMARFEVNHIVRDTRMLTHITDPGVGLDAILLEACRVGDRNRINTVLREYVAWLHSHAVDGQVSGSFAVASITNVVIGNEWRVRDPSWCSTISVDVEHVIVWGLFELVTKLITGGLSHPWTSYSDGVNLLAMVAGGAGVIVTDEKRHAAIALDVAFRQVELGLSNAETEGLRDRLTRLRCDEPETTTAGFARLRSAWIRQRDEIAHLRERTVWDHQILASRDLAIAKLEAELSLYRSGFFGRIIKLLRMIASSARGEARKVFRKAKQLRNPS